MTFFADDIDDQLRALFGAPLCLAAQRLLADGDVRDVRSLQGGRVLTGVVTHSSEPSVAHRVYIQRPHSTGFEGLETECSCGERGPCAHVAAVSIAATRLTPGVPSGRRPSTVAPLGRALRAGSTQRQCLYYLFEDGTDAVRGDCIQVSLWVGPSRADGERIDADRLVPFDIRTSAGLDAFPRYVDDRDKAILTSLAALRSMAPWALHDESGASVLQQSIATGRAFWKSLQGTPLQAGRTRQVPFHWVVMSNGEQRLRGQTSGAVRIALGLEPPAYIDTAANVCGTLQASCPVHLLRAHASRPPVPPEHVVAMNEQIAAEGAASFPRLRELTIRTQSLTTLEPKLVLAHGPMATLHFIYNGLDVDGRLLRAGGAARRMSTDAGSDVCWEIARDEAAERRFRSELEAHLPGAGQGAGAWLNFMMQHVPALQAQGWSIHVEEDFPYRVVPPDAWYADANSAREGNWFDLRLGVTVGGKEINLLPTLITYLQSTSPDTKASYTRVGEHLLIRLEDNRHLPIPLERIERIAHTLVELHEGRSASRDEVLTLPVGQASRVAQLAIELDAREVRSDDDALRSLIDELASFSGIQPVVPPAHFRATLRPYQQEGCGWLQFLRRHRLGGILADDMGLGKTIQTLAHLTIEKTAGRLNGPSLIVAPVSVIGNWQQELQRFAPDLNAVTLHGSRRKEHFASVSTADVVITSYSLLQIESEFLLSRTFCYLILDEAQTIKNPRAGVSQVARMLRSQYRLCLTGTPMENHLGELWSLFDFLEPGLLGTEREFQRRYRVPIEKKADERRAQALSRRIAPFVLRRTKQAVARELPPKTQIVESLVLEESQRDFYDGIRLAMHRRVREVIQEQGLARSHITVLDALLKLRQACCDPRLIRDDAETRALPSAKLDWLRTVLPELAAEGRRVLLFSQFTSMLRLIEAAVSELSIPYCLLTGETRERAELVRRFQSGSVPLFLISLKAGGVGLNLTAADTVIHYDPWWNPAVEAQATDRAHRIGQDRPVFVYKLIVQGTIEEKIMQLQADKHTLASQLFSAHAASPLQWTTTDIETLFAP